MELQVFTNQQFGQIRVVAQNGEPWFVGKDVADVLGYKNPRKAMIDHVDEGDKTDGVTIRDTIGRNQNRYVLMNPAYTASSFPASCRLQKSLSTG